MKAIILALCLIMTISACNFNVNLPTPTAEGILETVDPLPNIDESATPTPSLSPSLSPTAEEVALLVSPTPSGSPMPPTETLTLTPTQGPFEHRVQANETLYDILVQYGYFTLDVVSAVAAINPNISDLNSLNVGQVVLIPRQTLTPTPIGFEATQAINATLGFQRLSGAFPPNTEFGCHTVEEGETIIEIAIDYNTTIEVLKDQNPTIPFLNCDFNIRSGGAECTVPLRIDQCVRVPFPTATITLSPTPSGSETATPTPTHSAPRIIQPISGAIVQGVIALQWVSVGVLQDDEAYFIVIRNLNDPNAAPTQRATRNTSLLLPEELIPTDGQDRVYEWTVSVARRNQQGVYAMSGGVGSPQQFTVRSR
ncbi:MAG: LysM peptidoglycan-binding domain-containing protein [Anaerolineae bacterium]|jgi:LysM repeat protein|nr:LysM peptidoglycan-binding domain-containing protein [Anaerolineae bacterium]